MEIIEPRPERPWQGTVLAVLNVLGLVMGFLVFMLLMIGSGFVESVIQDSTFSVIMGFGRLVIFMLGFPFIVLAVFITVGLFRGQKWAVITMMVFTIFALLNSISGLFSGNGAGFLGPVIINGLVLYCEIASLKDPFYK
ncbi:MAG: hypothetical protein GXO47_13075 [Chlorobi bacterium]|nr:hypothetical protein [Chlorobiota bacterium]